MVKKLYVGNLPWSVKNDDLAALFTPFGEVVSAMVIMDRMNPTRSKGFGFVEMEEGDAMKAIEAMNGKMVGDNGKERPLTVNEARPLEPRENRGGGNRSYGQNRNQDMMDDMSMTA